MPRRRSPKRSKTWLIQGTWSSRVPTGAFRSSQRPVLVMNSGTVMTDLPALARVDAEFYADLWERLRLHHWDQSELTFRGAHAGQRGHGARFGRAGQDAIFALEFLDPDRDVGYRRARSPTIPRRQRCPLCTACPDGATSRRTRPPPYDDVQRQLTAAATVDGLIRVVGRPRERQALPGFEVAAAAHGSGPQGLRRP